MALAGIRLGRSINYSESVVRFRALTGVPTLLPAVETGLRAVFLPAFFFLALFRFFNEDSTTQASSR